MIILVHCALQADGSMDSDNFKDFAKEMAEYITNYMENIRDRWAS